MAFFSSAAIDVPCRLLLSTTQGAQLKGSDKEEGLRAVRESSGANVQLLEGGRRLPAVFKARDECLVVIQADRAQELRAAIGGALRGAFISAPQRASGDVSGDRPRTVEVMIPEVATRHLVGAGGDRIKLLREEAGCEVQMAPGAVAGVAAQRRVRCNGLIPQLTEAVARIHEVLVEFAQIGILHARHFELQEVNAAPSASSREAAAAAAKVSRVSRIAVRLFVGKDECGWLIGKRGNKIHKLRELALVSTRDAEEEVVQVIGQGSVVEVFGAPLQKELCVLQLIVDDLALMRDALPLTRLVVPTELAPSALTADRLEEVRRQSNARRVLLLECGATWSVVELEGGDPERLAAAGAVHELLEQAAVEKEAAKQNGLSASHTGGAGVGVGGGSLSVAAASARTAATPAKLDTPLREPDSLSVASPSATSAAVESLRQSVVSDDVRPLGHRTQRPGTEVLTAGSQQEAWDRPTPSAPSRAASNAAEASTARSFDGSPCYCGSAGGSGLAQATGEAASVAPAIQMSPQGPVLTLAVQVRGEPAAGALERAKFLASDSSGIAWRTGVDLQVAASVPGGCDPQVQATLLIRGTPVANAIACLLVQRALWTERALRRRGCS
eukprot:TRINITY_DN15082_c0_g1_i1.p1 TRINITY_DN15082_c0_g1~~TRINITY_DN15082_c0_g1_i1.p1  ORF type:complete len:615 (+),score=136.44 TRINITY_DN15082_c0_g1_i1:140-1984(+)